MKKIEVDIVKLKTLYDSGLTIIQCAKKMGVGRDVIWKRLHENNISVRPQYKWKAGVKHSEEHKAKISKSNKGRIVSEETREKISKANFGKIRTEEQNKAKSEYQKGILSGEKNPLWQGGVSLEYDPVKEKVHNIIRHLKRTGQLINQPCETCGKFPAHAHHDDYTKPLELRWLCPKHHRKFHMAHRLKNYKYVPKEQR